MAQFRAVELAYYVLVFLVYATVCGFSSAALACLKGKGKEHYRAWLLPGTIGNAVGALLSLIVLVRFLLHIRPTMTSYYLLWAGYGVVAATAVYAAVRLWRSVRDAPLIAGPPSPSHITEAPASVWPPPPEPPR